MKEKILIIADVCDLNIFEKYFDPKNFHIEIKQTVQIDQDYVKELGEKALVGMLYNDTEADKKTFELLTDEGLAPIVCTPLDDEELRTKLNSEGAAQVIIASSLNEAAESVCKAIERQFKNKRIKVLAVDDSKVFRTLIGYHLENHYFQVFSATNGREALEVIEKEPDIRLVITDFKMPEMDGLELTSEIRKHYDKDTMAIVALSAESNSNVTAQFLYAGANDYIIKPFSHEEFNSRITNMLEHVENIEAILKHQVILDQYKEAIDDSSIVSKTDINGRITYVNDAFCNVSGYSAEELIGKSHSVVRHPDTPSSTFTELWGALKSNRTWQGMIQNRNKSGQNYFVAGTVLPLLDERGEAMEYIAIWQDLTKVIDQEERIRKQITDLLTGLPNRQKLIEDLGEYPAGLLSIINIDGFGKINDFFGQANGDKILIEFGQKIRSNVEEDTEVYRLQADEFAVFRPNATLDDKRSLIDENMKKLTEAPYRVSDEEIYLEVSVGLAEGVSEDLIIHAGIAKKLAKSRGTRMVVFDPSMIQSDQFEKNMHYLHMLKTAITNDKIVPYYQPIVNLKTGVIEKYECLVRLIDEEGKEVSPYFFLDVAKQAKLYPIITQRVIEKTFALFAQNDLEFSINLSVEDVTNPHTMSFLKEHLDRYGIGKRVVIEIVEQEGIEDMGVVQSFIQEMRSYGCKISIDDFGTGYSNFEYLLELNVDYIKIDGSIIKRVVEDPNSRLITKTITDFSSHLNSKTIGEFASSAEICDVLKEIGVDYGQGFYLGKPLPDIVRN